MIMTMTIIMTMAKISFVLAGFLVLLVLLLLLVGRIEIYLFPAWRGLCASPASRSIARSGALPSFFSVVVVSISTSIIITITMTMPTATVAFLLVWPATIAITITVSTANELAGLIVIAGTILRRQLTDHARISFPSVVVLILILIGAPRRPPGMWPGGVRVLPLGKATFAMITTIMTTTMAMAREGEGEGEGQEGTPERLRAVEIELYRPPVMADNHLDEDKERSGVGAKAYSRKMLAGFYMLSPSPP